MVSLATANDWFAFARVLQREHGTIVPADRTIVEIVRSNLVGNDLVRDEAHRVIGRTASYHRVEGIDSVGDHWALTYCTAHYIASPIPADISGEALAVRIRTALARDLYLELPGLDAWSIRPVWAGPPRRDPSAPPEAEMAVELSCSTAPGTWWDWGVLTPHEAPAWHDGRLVGGVTRPTRVRVTPEEAAAMITAGRPALPC